MRFKEFGVMVDEGSCVVTRQDKSFHNPPPIGFNWFLSESQALEFARTNRPSFSLVIFRELVSQQEAFLSLPVSCSQDEMKELRLFFSDLCQSLVKIPRLFYDCQKINLESSSSHGLVRCEMSGDRDHIKLTLHLSKTDISVSQNLFVADGYFEKKVEREMVCLLLRLFNFPQKTIFHRKPNLEAFWELLEILKKERGSIVFNVTGGIAECGDIPMPAMKPRSL